MSVAPKSKLQELKNLDEAIADRKRYYREQEALINDLVESGNTQLMSLMYEISLAKQQLRDLKTDIRTAAQDKVMLNEDLHILRQEAQLLTVRTTFIGISLPNF